ncbi:hypothetical protein DVA86_16015 [Streptomyces armeniacus]|uniref:Uncharacterized protein n=1 Tax=Streptomyces armeniacus TaxID=83291 RepID=A0A345XQM6_9ACTN|nr:hypothetical protein [Streptomyces armeniacus]AXK33942.1 hypothetical protein DVA86_16015 [Streptomyces armeniacus]
MGQGLTLARGARVFGAVALLLLAVISLGWIIRDFNEAGEISDVWWMWAGMATRAESGLWASSPFDPVLLVVYVVAAAVTIRSSSAAGILTATGVLTVAVRLPSLWNLNADWMQGVDEDLKSKALFSAIGAVTLGVALVIVAIAGRRPADGGGAGGYGGGYGFAPVSDPAQEAPGRPAPGPAMTAFLLLGACAAALIAWEIDDWNRQDWDSYEQTLTGERTLLSLLSPPGAWVAWAVALLALAGAVAAASRATFARPLGLVTGGVLLGTSVLFVSLIVKQEMLQHFGDLETRGQLSVVTYFFTGFASLAVLIALAQRAQPAPVYGGPPPYAAGGHDPYGPPPPAPPPGW